MSERRRQPWWWQSEVLARIAMALFAIVVASYLAQLLTQFAKRIKRCDRPRQWHRHVVLLFLRDGTSRPDR